MAIQNNAPFVRHVGGTEGTTGWTRTDVLNAIEQVLADAGIHGSSERKAGVVVNVLAPGSTSPYNSGGSNHSNWWYAGGGQCYMPHSAYREIRVTANGNSNYVLNRVIHPSYFWTNGEIRFRRTGGGTRTFATMISEGYPIESLSGLYQDGVRSGDSFYLRNPSGDPATIPAELTVGNQYFIIMPDDYSDITNTNYIDTIKIASSYENATANPPVPITFASDNSGGDVTQDANINALHIEFEFPAVTKVTVRQGDWITFHLTNLTGHPTTIVDSANSTLTFPGGTYSDERELNITNFENGVYNRLFPQNLGLETGRIYWNVEQWAQGDYVLQCRNHHSMQNVIEVQPSYRQNMTYTESNHPYWDYEVPASGGREACTFRVYRRGEEWTGDYEGAIEGIRIQTPDAKGWSVNEVFTIPGDQIGGVSPKHDIVFGVNSNTTQQQADFNAVPSVQVMDIGSGGTNFVYKYVQSNAAFLEIVNDANKEYGTTYYGIKLHSDNNYRLQIGAGVQWNYLNWNPTTASEDKIGCWGGENGFDISASHSNFDWDETQYNNYNYANGSNANTYALKVQVWKANTNDPQDSNFHILQFVQNIAGKDESQLSLYFHKGTVIGNGIWDLDHVWQGCYTTFAPVLISTGSENTVRFQTSMPKYHYSAQEDLETINALRRCAEYGYFRNANASTDGTAETYYTTNLYTDNNTAGSRIKPYFRDHSFDKTTTTLNYLGDNPLVNIDYGGGQRGKPTGGTSNYQNQASDYVANKNDIPVVNQISSAANYYKPIKGLPIQSCWAPVPYYLPDDFVVIPFNVTPGATTFHPGDSIEVSASEIYKIVEVSYSVNQTTYDGVASNSSEGIAFCARTT